MRLQGVSHARALSIRNTASEKGTEEALSELQSDKPFYVAAVKVLKDNLRTDKTLREEAASLELQAAGRELSRRLTGLTTIAGLAPLLGLLGTVIGLMVAFQSLEAQPGLLSRELLQAACGKP